MNAVNTQLNEEEFFFANIVQFQDGALDSTSHQRFEQIVKKYELEQKLVDFGIVRGQLQLDFQNICVDEYLIHQLHVLVEDDAARANHEASDIEEFSKGVLFGRIVRGGLIVVLLLVFAGVGYYFLAPKSKPKFSALDSLVYEAAVMIEDPEGRLDFPTNSLDELRDYFSRYPDLGFHAKPIKSPGEGWNLDGGTVIDYEVQKIIAAQFDNPQGDKLFIYLFEGDLEDFPYSEPGNYKGLLYQTYASDYFNVVVFGADEGVLGMVVGSRKVEELAQVAHRSISAN